MSVVNSVPELQISALETQCVIDPSLNSADDESPAVTVADAHGNVCREIFYKYGLLHRDNGKPAVRVQGESLVEEWYIDGVLARRDGGPVRVLTKPSGKVLRFWFKDGLLHRDHDLPAVEKLKSAGGKQYQSIYFQNGKLHRDNDQPAMMVLKRDRIVMWAMNGIACRADPRRPTVIQMCQDGRRIFKFHVNGVLHSVDDRPAIVSESPRGIKVSEWYENDVQSRGDDMPQRETVDYRGQIYRQVWCFLGVISRPLNPTEPCIVEYNYYGKVQRETWYLNDKIGRENDLPAVVETILNGGTRLSWFSNGLRHRENGPAVMELDTNDQIIKVTFYNHGLVHNGLLFKPVWHRASTVTQLSFANQHLFDAMVDDSVASKDALLEQCRVFETGAAAIATCNKTWECAICFESVTFADAVCPSDCLHTFHVECVERALERSPSCPVCRASGSFTTPLQDSIDRCLDDICRIRQHQALVLKE